MSFLTPFKFDKTSLFTVTIDGKVWTRAKEVIHGALGYGKSTKTAYEVRAHCSLENYAHKYQLISVRTERTPMKWPIDSQKYDFYINEEGMYELLFKSQQLQAKAFRKYCCNEMFPKIRNQLLRQRIEEKDTQLALLSDDLALKQEHARQLEYSNIGLQGEIRAKDQEIVRRQSEIAELRERYVDHCRDPRKDNTVMITRKHTSDEDDEHFEYPYYISRIQRCKIPTKRRWLLTQFPDSEEIVVIDNPNSVHAFNRLEEEGHVERYGCHFKLIDLTREDLYDMGVPSIKE